jgi:hypothetical protein
MAELGQTSDATRLVRGSVSAVESAAVQWKRRATTAEEVSASLSGLAMPEGWAGAGADGFAARRRSVAARWERLSQAFSSAASALDAYREALAAGQRQAGRAIELWEDGQRATREALDPSSSADGGLPGVIVPPSLGDPGASGRAQAKQVLVDARASVATAAATAASTIRGVAQEPALGPKARELLADTGLTAAEALADLAGLSGAELARVLKARPDLATLLATAEAQTVAPWWAGLDAGQRDAFIHAFPSTIGNLEGVAYADRDTANRLWLTDQVAEAEAALAKAKELPPWWELLGGKSVIEAHAQLAAAAQARVDALKNIESALASPKGRTERFLVSLTGDSPPLAAVSIGDLDTAQNVTYAVPGMGTSTEDMTGWARSAGNIQFMQDQLEPGNSHAVVAWIGYKTPPIPLTQGGPEVLDTRLADVGARKLDTALAGFAATRGSGGAQLNVVAHSYGTTTAAIALTAPGVHVDSFVSLGSAGLSPSIDSASDLNAGRVFAGQAQEVIPLLESGKGDAWAGMGRAFGNHPVNPVDPSFGARTFGTDTGVGGNPVNDHSVHTSSGNGYLDQGTESLTNVAAATTGQEDLMTAYEPHGLTPLQQGLLDGMTNAPR